MAAACPRAAGIHRAPHRPAAAALSDRLRGRRRSRLPLGLPGEGARAERAALVLGKHLDALLGVLEVAGAAPGQSDAFLEDPQRFLQRKVTGLEPAHDLLEPGQQSSNLRSVLP